jgi:UDP-N-acetylglucosamine acyltransferase
MPVAQIHPTAVVDPRAELGADVVIGPFCLVEAGAVLGDRCRLEARSIVKGRTVLGTDNEIGEGSVIGGKATVIGDHNLLMVGSHVGHDSRVGNHCILVNHVLLGGHVQVEDRAYVGGASAVHQFCRIGRLAMIGGLSRQVVGLNKVGLRRNGYTPEQILQLKAAYRVIYREGRRWSDVLDVLQRDFSTGPAAAFHDFLKTGKRGFVQERSISRRATLKLVDPREEDSDAGGAKKREAA